MVVALYPAFWKTFMDTYNVGLCLYVITFNLMMALSGTVIGTRVFIGVHTYNQLLIGGVWGFVIYYTVMVIFERQIHQMVTKADKINLAKFFKSPVILFLGVSTFMAVFLFLYLDAFVPTPLEWIQYMQRNCGNYETKETRPAYSNLIKFMLIYGVLGAYCGIIFEKKYLSTAGMDIFYQTSFCKSIARIFVTAVFGVPFGLPLLLLKGHNYSFVMTIILKSVIPTFMVGFYLTGISKYVCYKVGLVNTEVGQRRYKRE